MFVISLEKGIQIHFIALTAVLLLICLLSYSDIKKQKKTIPCPARVGISGRVATIASYFQQTLMWEQEFLETSRSMLSSPSFRSKIKLLD